MTADSVVLWPVIGSDLSIFFEHQLDTSGNQMAAFTAKDPADREAFMTHWSKILADATIIAKTITFEDQVAGHIASFKRGEKREVTYRIDKTFWGRGIATAALTAFGPMIEERPLFARAAKDNVASLRVLEKCSFTICGEDKCFSNARGKDVEEFILRLDAG